VIVLAIRKPDDRTIFNPPAETEIAEEDYLIAMESVSDVLGLEVVRSA
jgi:uncharacterized protein with PhoU and TrkA domain